MKITRSLRSDEYAARLPAKLAEIKKDCSIDRSETSFKGKSVTTVADLNPDPVESARMRSSQRW